MKAVVLEQRGTDGIRIGDFPDPEPGPGDIVLKVEASSINRVDLYMRDNGAGINHELPLVLGLDAVGEIAHAPRGSAFRPGDRAILYPMAYCNACRFCRAGDHPICVKFDVAGETRHGAFAEFISMPERCFLPLPGGMDTHEAATLSIAYLTAWRMMFGKKPLMPHETVLIVGVGGGVAAACLQMAKMVGARTIVTSSTDEKLAWAKSLGADHGINYATENVPRAVREITGGEGVDMAVDSVGEASWGGSLRSLRRGGRIVTCGATTGGNPPTEIQRLFAWQIEIYGSTMGSMEEFRQLVDAVSRGKIRPAIDRVYALDDIRDGFARMSSGEQSGKLVVRVAG